MFQYSKMPPYSKTPLYSNELTVPQSPSYFVSLIQADLQESTARLIADLYPHAREAISLPPHLYLPLAFFFFHTSWCDPSHPATHTPGSTFAMILKSGSFRIFGTQKTVKVESVGPISSLCLMNIWGFRVWRGKQ